MVKKGTCGLCQGGCAVVYTIENGKIVKAEPDKESPKGRLCPRGALVPDILYGEERIKRPLLRVGERGEGKFRECSWEEAIDKAAELLKKTADTYGGRSLASYYGRGILGLPVTACPAGVTGSLFALRYEKDSVYAAEIFAMTTIISIVTVPFSMLFC